MLEKLDMSKKISKVEYSEAMDELEKRLGSVQRRAREAKKPVIIVFEGWRGARRSTLINKMMQCMDARGFDVYSTVGMTNSGHDYPFFTFFWQKLPARGHMAVYHRSWYYLKNANEVLGDTRHGDGIGYSYINSFEKMLTDDGYVILKYFLHLTPEQQKKNLSKHSKSLGKAWRDICPAVDETGRYEEFLERYERMLGATDTVNAPWHLIAADDSRNAQLEVFKSIVETIERVLEAQECEAPSVRPAASYDVLSRVQPTQEMSKEEYKDKLDKYQKKLTQLQVEMFRARIPSVFCFEGWDAAGKGGAIRRLTAALDPLGFSVHPVSAPNVVENQFHYLWRFWIHQPAPGAIAIFDRSWYGRVMVERVEGFAKDHEWQRAYDEIRDMEQQWAEHGVAIAKFWLQIDKEEQLKRFNERQGDVYKQWKITDEDWRNRDKWQVYEEAVNEMLVRTDTYFAPWTIVEGNNKYYARLKVLKTVIDLFEKKLGK